MFGSSPSVVLSATSQQEAKRSMESYSDDDLTSASDAEGRKKGSSSSL